MMEPVEWSTRRPTISTSPHHDEDPPEFFPELLGILGVAYTQEIRDALQRIWVDGWFNGNEW